LNFGPWFANSVARVSARAPGFPVCPKGIFAAGILAIIVAGPATADPVVTCNGSALMIGTLLLCSHNDAHRPPQLCSFSWALATAANQTHIVDGSFLMLPGVTNFQAYAGSGFTRAMSNPIVICKGKQGSRK
jgi:hypothetical protein